MKKIKAIKQPYTGHAFYNSASLFVRAEAAFELFVAVSHSVLIVFLTTTANFDWTTITQETDPLDFTK